VLQIWVNNEWCRTKNTMVHKFHFKVTVRLFPIIVIEKPDPLILFSRQWQPLMQRGASAFLCILRPRFLLAMLRFSSLRMFLSCEAFFLYVEIFVNFLLMNFAVAISLTACASIIIGTFLRDVIEAFSVLRSVFDSWQSLFFNLKNMPRIIRRTCLSISQSVASEAIELFVLCPFQLSGLSRCPIVFECLLRLRQKVIRIIGSITSCKLLRPVVLANFQDCFGFVWQCKAG